MPEALELAQVSKVYEVGGVEVVALNHIDLVVAEREVVTLLGPSGSGKTTLLSIAGGLLTPSSGTVMVGGQDITRFSARKLTKFRRRYVGFIFQAVNLVPFLTARENLLVVAELTRRDRRKATRRADALLDGLGLSHRLDNLPGQLSGGEKQRVAIGRALMNEPTLVLVDEPTSALDSRMGEQVMELIVSEVKARDAAAVVVTHDQRMTRYGDRILTMGDGRIASIQPRPEWTTHRPDPELEPEPDYAESEPQAEPWVAGGGAVGYGQEAYPRSVGTTGTAGGAGLYGGRAGRAAAGWSGFPQPERTGPTNRVGDGGSVPGAGARSAGARRPSAPPGTAGTTGGAGVGAGGDRAAGRPTGPTSGRSSTGRGRTGGDDAMEGFFGPERRGRRWRRPEGGTPTSRARGAAAGRAADAGAADVEWGHFEDPSISPPGGVPQVDAGWSGADESAAPTTAWSEGSWSQDDTNPGQDAPHVPGADERLDPSWLDEPVPEGGRWGYDGWPPSRPEPVIDVDADMDNGPIDVSAVVETGRVDPVDVARAAIHQARAQAGSPPGTQRPRGAQRPPGAQQPPGRAAPRRRPAAPPVSPPGGTEVPGASPWAPAPAGNLGPLPPAPGPDDDDPPRGRKRRRPGKP